MENKVVAGQLAIVKKIIRIVSSHRRQDKKDSFGEYNLSDQAWNGCVDFVLKELKNFQKSLKRQL